MRIQHNIMAMNAYRNYNNNTSALSKNLEKLSSGYKINRAGDDAAGLAISEKMRAQITGLNAAQKNVKDGISLVKTAEGAMQEIQDMLNRMDYLATQSANGTYDNEVDRKNLQKEVDQLKSEIDRIADSANFNGIKLLDGSLDENVKATAATSTVKESTIEGLAKFSEYGDRNVVTATKNNAIPHKDAQGSGKTSFEFDFNAKKLTATADGEMKFELGILRKPMTGTPDIAAAYYEEISLGTDFKAGDELTGEDLAKAIYAGLGGTDDTPATINLNFGADQDTSDGAAGDVDDTDKAISVEYTVELKGDRLVFTMSDTGYAAAVAGATDAANADRAEGTGVSTDGSDPFQGNFTLGAYNLTNATAESFADMGTTNIKVGSASAGVQMAHTMVNMENVLVKDNKVVDGGGIQIGNEKYVFAASDETANAQYDSSVKVVDIRDLVDENGAFKTDEVLQKELGGKISGQVRALARLTEVAKDNDMFDVQMPFGDGAIAMTERIDNNTGADLSTSEKVAEQIKFFTGIKSNVTETAASGKDGKALQLQIGDTSDPYNQLQVSIGDMHTAALKIGDLDIGTAESASAAIQTIKDAINYVSGVRGDLGSYQNRLEHTQNNLSVMAENIQDAESTIRDTDVAEEMMSYVKNNILVQSAQAMLAQANQVPQGVLQLLG